MEELITDPLYEMLYALLACFAAIGLFMLGEWIKDKFRKK
jgi:uncharacterized protein (DUF2461 family)